jgi:hypothetical protein
MAIEDVIRKTERSFDMKKFLKPVEQLDYSDRMYEVIHGNIVGGSRAHCELIGPMCLKEGPEFV